MVKKTVAALAAALGLLAMTATVTACEFSFNYSEIAAPLSTVGEIGVRVQKDHNNCTLPSMDDYQFMWENIQVLGETAWEEIGSNLYEKWFEVSLSEIGDGYLKISKDCTKEGYEEAGLPITILAPGTEGLWQDARAGGYPLDTPEASAVETVFGSAVYADGILALDGVTIELTLAPGILDDSIGEAQAFFIRSDGGEAIPLLLVSEHFFLRFDHLVSSEG